MNGVAAFLQKQNDGTVSLVLNDVEALSETENPDWKHINLYSSNCYDANALKNLSLSKDQLAEIGENLLIRLLALNGVIK